MKIIKQPSTNPWWAGKQGTCNHCGTVIELEAGDSSKIMGGQTYALYAICPTCDRTIQITGFDKQGLK